MERVRLVPRAVKRSPLLPTESVEEYERDRCAMKEAIKPRDAIEQIYCDDLVDERLQTARLRRWRTAMMKTAFAEAVYAVLRDLDELENIDVDYVVREACIDSGDKAALSEILARHGLDVSAIELEAFRRCAPDLITIDQLLTSHSSRRDKAVQMISVLGEIKPRRPQLAPPANSRVPRLRSVKNGERTTTHG